MLWWIAAALCAYFVKGICGFTNTLVFTTILSFADHNVNISPVDLLLGCPANFLMAWRERRYMDRALCLRLSLLVAAGSLPGILLLKQGSTGTIKILFGLVVFFVALELLRQEFRAEKRKPSRWAMAVIGLLSGLLCGLYGVGALLGAYIGSVTEDSRAFKANLCAVLCAENCLRLVLYTGLGIINGPAFFRALWLIPFSLAGLWLGMKAGGKLDEKRVRLLVIVMLMVSALALIRTGL